MQVLEKLERTMSGLKCLDCNNQKQTDDVEIIDIPSEKILQQLMYLIKLPNFRSKQC